MQNISRYIFFIVLGSYLLVPILAVFRVVIRNARRKKFIAAIRGGLDNGQIKNLQDVRNIFGGIYDLDEEEDDNPSDLGRLMKKVLVAISETSEKNTKEQAEILNGLIAECNKISPYYRLPKKERLIFTSLETHVAASQIDDARRNLHELVATILYDKEEYEKLKKENKWSIPLAVVGNVLTFVFGILSLVK